MNSDQLVPPLFEPEADNAAGAFYVIKDHCIICALPIETAPASVSWNRCIKKREEGEDYRSLHCRIHKQPETKEEIRAMIEAAVSSCVEAIRYRGTNDDILAEFRKVGMERLCDTLQK
jgi:hypothetical protein